MRRRWLPGAALLALTVAGAATVAALPLRPPTSLLRTVSAAQLAAVGLQLEGVPSPPPQVYAARALRRLHGPEGLVRAVAGGAPVDQVAPLPLEMARGIAAAVTVVGESAEAYATLDTRRLRHQLSWVFVATDPQIAGVRFLWIVDGTRWTRLVLPVPLRGGALAAPGCGAGAPAPAGGIAPSALSPNLVADRPGLVVRLCAVPEWTGARWEWKVVTATGGYGCVPPIAASPTLAANVAIKCRPEPTLATYHFDYFTGRPDFTRLPSRPAG